MVSADGIEWNPNDNKIYVADFLGNAAHMVDMQGNVTALHKNGDTDAVPMALLTSLAKLLLEAMNSSSLTWIWPGPFLNICR